ncbi:hypothetical protein E4T56_gene18529 [Termitomyces sp. T112]|nr:hypothetical protein E4T56_gene18529 [Termitomyces sp. T112]
MEWAEGGGGTMQLSQPVLWIPAHHLATSQFPKTPNTPLNFCPCPAPILVSPDTTSANSDASLANSDASLANSDASLANSDASLANSDASLANSDASLANSDASPANSNGPLVTTHPLNPRTSSINPPNPQKTPDAPPNFRPCPAPISANSDAFPANSDGPLANFGAFPAATDTYLGSPEPQEPPLLFLIFATHHQLNTLVPLTYSGVSRQPWGDPHSPMIPSTYQHSPILDRNRHLPTLSSSAKPRCHSQHTLKFSGTLPSPTAAADVLQSSPVVNHQIIPHPTLTLSANSVPSHKVDPDVTQRTAFQNLATIQPNEQQCLRHRTNPPTNNNTNPPQNHHLLRGGSPATMGPLRMRSSKPAYGPTDPLATPQTDELRSLTTSPKTTEIKLKPNKPNNRARTPDLGYPPTPEPASGPRSTRPSPPPNK